MSSAISASCPSGTLAPEGDATGTFPSASRVRGGLVVEAHGEREAALALEHGPHDLPGPGGLDGVEHVAHRDAVAGAAVAVDADADHRQARRLLELHVGRAGDAGHDPRDLLALLAQRVEVVAEELDPHVGADAGDQLVEAHLDRLVNEKPIPGTASSRASLIFSTSSPLVRAVVHSERGFSITNTSPSSMPMTSVASSGLPERLTTVIDLREALQDPLHPPRARRHLGDARPRPGGWR